MSLFLSGLKRFSFFFHFLFFKVFPSSNSFFFSAYQFDKAIFYILLLSRCTRLLQTRMSAYLKKSCFYIFSSWDCFVFLFYITVWRNVLRLCCWSTNAWNYVSFQCQWINIHLFWWDFLFYFALFWFTLIDLEILLRSPGCWVDWIKVKILNLILRHHSSIPGHGLQVQL